MPQSHLFPAEGNARVHELINITGKNSPKIEFPADKKNLNGGIQEPLHSEYAEEVHYGRRMLEITGTRTFKGRVFLGKC
ncbi:MAG: hypothetical protein HY912_24350 [Desulfomonile tiedjei]|uniref:Uncharacterized protein n=1 Tax=Desulfomonile tiedjei TaxID=2358 RepID=A0A9D6V802_9BACT|nr:hypothetical protein [Desulfomonile tiedjei]